ncbi:MAG: alpha/beta hydrolase [Candidatus Heimdallarchaeota archaeon]|nr:alpha/beta hydrolase [Candidatus Heimdallarchaeota archaeon]
MIRTIEYDFEEPKKKNMPYIVFVHGAGGSKAQWRKQVDFFKSLGFGLLVPNLPGHGSSKPIEMTSVSHFAKTIIDLITELRVEPFILCGHSMGGAIILDITLKYSIKNLKKVILIGTGAKLNVAPLFFELIENNFDQALEMMEKFAYGEEVDPNIIIENKKIFQGNGAQILLQDFNSCTKFDIRGHISQNISVPVLIICGEQDRLTPVKYSKYLQENIKGSELIVIPRVGHFAFQEAKDQVNTIINKFIQT